MLKAERSLCQGKRRTPGEKSLPQPFSVAPILHGSQTDRRIELVFYRHGETPGNVESRYIGRTDEPLSADGAASLCPAPEDSGTRKVYVSPLRRTIQSAGILFPGAEQVVCPGFSEMDFGVFEGKNYRELSGDPRYRAWVDSGCTSRCPDGEEQAAFVERVCREFERMLERALAEGAAKLCFVVHGGTVMAVFSRYACPRRPYFDWRIRPGARLAGWFIKERWQEEKCFFLERQGGME